MLKSFTLLKRPCPLYHNLLKSRRFCQVYGFACVSVNCICCIAAFVHQSCSSTSLTTCVRIHNQLRHFSFGQERWLGSSMLQLHQTVPQKSQSSISSMGSPIALWDLVQFFGNCAAAVTSQALRNTHYFTPKNTQAKLCYLYHFLIWK